MARTVDGTGPVTLHGDVASGWGLGSSPLLWIRIRALLAPASELSGVASSADAMLDFAKGWDDGKQDHGRPAPIAFAVDGRMFVGDDMTGTVMWMAPVGLAQK